MNSIDSSKSVGNGRSIMVWEDLWVPNCPKFTPNQSQMIALGLAWELTNCLIIRAHDGMILSCFICLVRILSELSNLVQSAKRSKRILGYGH